MTKLKTIESDMRIGAWTTLEAQRKYTASGSWYKVWECVCDCGNVRLVDHRTLKYGRSLSCGCQSKSKRPKFKRGLTVAVNVNKTVFAKLQRKARKKDQSVAEYVRSLVLDSL